MSRHTSIGLEAITAPHANEVERFLAGIRAGKATWTMRPVVRKDDPPEEEDAK